MKVLLSLSVFTLLNAASCSLLLEPSDFRENFSVHTSSEAKATRQIDSAGDITRQLRARRNWYQPSNQLKKKLDSAIRGISDLRERPLSKRNDEDSDGGGGGSDGEGNSGGDKQRSKTKRPPSSNSFYDEEERNRAEQWDIFRGGEATGDNDPPIPEPDYPSNHRSEHHDKEYPHQKVYQRLGLEIIKNGNSYREFAFEKSETLPGVRAFVSPKDGHIAMESTERGAGQYPGDLLYWCWQAGTKSSAGQEGIFLEFITLHGTYATTSDTLKTVSTIFKAKNVGGNLATSINSPWETGDIGEESLAEWDKAIGVEDISSIQNMLTKYLKGLAYSTILGISFAVSKNPNNPRFSAIVDIVIQLKKGILAPEILSLLDFPDYLFSDSSQDTGNPLTIHPGWDHLDGTSYKQEMTASAQGPPVPSYLNLKLEHLWDHIPESFQLAISGPEKHIVFVTGPKLPRFYSLLAEIMCKHWKEQQGLAKLAYITFLSVTTGTDISIREIIKSRGKGLSRVLILDSNKEEDRPLIESLQERRELRVVREILKKGIGGKIASVQIGYPAGNSADQQDSFMLIGLDMEPLKLPSMPAVGGLLADTSVKPEEEPTLADALEAHVPLAYALTSIENHSPVSLATGIRAHVQEALAADFQRSFYSPGMPAPPKFAYPIISSQSTPEFLIVMEEALILLEMSTAGKYFGPRYLTGFKDLKSRKITPLGHVVPILPDFRLTILKSIGHTDIVLPTPKTLDETQTYSLLPDILFQAIKGAPSVGNYDNEALKEGLDLPRTFTIQLSPESWDIIKKMYIRSDIKLGDTMWVFAPDRLDVYPLSIGNPDGTTGPEQENLIRWFSLLSTREVSIIVNMNAKFLVEMRGQTLAGIYIRWRKSRWHSKVVIVPELFIVCGFKPRPQRFNLLEGLTQHAATDVAINIGLSQYIEGFTARVVQNSLTRGTVPKLREIGSINNAPETFIGCPTEVLELLTAVDYRFISEKKKLGPQYYGYEVEIKGQNGAQKSTLDVRASKSEKSIVLGGYRARKPKHKKKSIEAEIDTLSTVYQAVWAAHWPGQHKTNRIFEQPHVISILGVCEFTARIIRSIDTKRTLARGKSLKLHENDPALKDFWGRMLLLGTPEVGGLQRFLVDFPKHTKGFSIEWIYLQQSASTGDINVLICIAGERLTEENADNHPCNEKRKEHSWYIYY